LLSEETLGGMLMRSAMRHGSRRAFVDQDSEWTYSNLGEAAWMLARCLAAAGVTKGTRVGILMPNSAEWLVAAFAAALNGAVIVGVSTLASPAEREHILRFSDTNLLLMSVRSGPRDLMAELVERHPFLAASAPGQMSVAMKKSPLVASSRSPFLAG
jgi:acyl-CoA synthetase (AMP-forming)/AMP-acid ligase II